MNGNLDSSISPSFANSSPPDSSKDNKIEISGLKRIKIKRSTDDGGERKEGFCSLFVVKEEGGMWRAVCGYIPPRQMVVHWGRLDILVSEAINPESLKSRDSIELQSIKDNTYTPCLGPLALNWKQCGECFLFNALDCSVAPRPVIKMKSSVLSETATTLSLDSEFLEKVVGLSVGDAHYSTRLLDAKKIGDKVWTLISVSSLCSPPSSHLGYLDEGASGQIVIKLDASALYYPIKEPTRSCCVSILDGRDVFIRQEPKSEKDVILYLHGGPNSCCTTDYSQAIDFFVQLGYDVLCPNYSGSVGFPSGAEETELSGQIGAKDVTEVAEKASKYLQDYQNIFLYGGSHGGFLATLLSGKYPGIFKAVSVRNPVCNLLTMLSSSDIPDWVISQTLGRTFDPSELHPLSATDLGTLYMRSPIYVAKCVTTPTLIGLGADDRRVPPYQGIEYFKALMTNKDSTKDKHRLLWYPKNSHPISAPECESDYIINTHLWFKKHSH